MVRKMFSVPGEEPTIPVCIILQSTVWPAYEPAGICKEPGGTNVLRSSGILPVVVVDR